VWCGGCRFGCRLGWQDLIAKYQVPNADVVDVLFVLGGVKGPKPGDGFKGHIKASDQCNIAWHLQGTYILCCN
jgi:hypothetical protein